MARPLRDSSMTVEAGKLKVLLPHGVQVIFSDARHVDAELHPKEQEFLSARRMQPVREREFRIGRALARDALAQFDITDHPLLPAETREPIWPSGIVGSISHCESACAVAVAEAKAYSGIGIDLERIERIDDRITGSVCTPDEQRQLETLEPSLRRHRLALLFSAKESVFKALFPSTRQWLEFTDVSLALADGRFTAHAAEPGVRKVEFLNGRYFVGPSLIATAAWLPAD